MVHGGAGILYINIRVEPVDNSLTIKKFVWIANNGLISREFILSTNGNKFYLYAYVTHYSRYTFTVLQENSLDDNKSDGLFVINRPLNSDFVNTPTGIYPLPYEEAKQINFSNTSNYNGNVKYYTKNGVCYAYVFAQVANPSDSWVTILSGLPKPLLQDLVQFAVVTQGNVNSQIRAWITKGGSLSLHGGTTSGTDYVAAVAYIVDDTV